MVSDEQRETIRALHGYCCGHCGVTETDSGGELEREMVRLLRIIANLTQS